MAGNRLQPLRTDHRQREPAGKLRASRLGGGEHLRLFDQHSRVRELAAGFEVEDREAFGHVLDKRRQCRIEVSGIELDARKRTSCREPLQLLVPVRAHVSTQRFQRNPLLHPIRGRNASARPQQQLATWVDRNRRHGHHRALVFGIEETKRLDHIARPLGTDGRVGRRRKDVEDPTAQRELAVLLNERLSRIAHLDQAARGHDRVRASAGRKDQGALCKVGGRDGRAGDGPSRRHDDRWGCSRRESVQRLHPLAHRLVESGRTVEERDRDLREDVGRGPAGEPGPQVVGEPIRRGHQDEHRAAGVDGGAHHRARHDRPCGPGQSRDAEFVGARRRSPPPQLRRRVQHPLPQCRHANSSQPSAPARLKRSIALSMPASRASSSASATPSTIFGNRSASALVKRPST